MYGGFGEDNIANEHFDEPFAEFLVTTWKHAWQEREDTF